MNFPRYLRNFYKSMYERGYLLNKGNFEGVNWIKIILEWSGGDYKKLNGEKTVISLEKYLEQKTGRYIVSRQRKNLKETLARFKEKFNQETFREIYEYCVQSEYSIQPTIEKNNRQDQHTHAEAALDSC